MFFCLICWCVSFVDYSVSLPGVFVCAFLYDCVCLMFTVLVWFVCALLCDGVCVLVVLCCMCLCGLVKNSACVLCLWLIG